MSSGVGNGEGLNIGIKIGIRVADVLRNFCTHKGVFTPVFYSCLMYVDVILQVHFWAPDSSEALC